MRFRKRAPVTDAAAAASAAGAKPDGRAADLAARAGAATAAAAVPLVAVIGASTTRSHASARRGRRGGRSAKSARARPIWSTGCCNRCPTFRRSGAQDAARALPGKAAADDFSAAERARSCAASRSRFSMMQVLPSCSRRAAAPNCRSSAALHGRRRAYVGRRPGRPLAVTADAVLIADYKTDRAVPPRAR